MPRLLASVALLCGVLLVRPVAGQVVESSPNPARTDQSVTITFHADRGNQGLKDCDCTVYAHTGLITSQSDSDSDWQYVMDEWHDDRELTKLEKVNANTYELTIPDIREYYSKNRTGAGDVPPKSEEEIKRLAFVFRNADGSKQGKTEGGGDIFVNVNDVGQGEAFLETNILSPDADPPLYPFMTAKDTTVDVTVTADTANVDSFDKLRLVVDDEPVDSTSSDSLTYGLSLNQPNRFRIRAEAAATTDDGTILRDTLETFLIRTPNVVDEARPSGVHDGINYNADGSVTLSLFAPKKEFVYAIGDFSNWKIDNQYFMKREKTSNGAHWWITIDGLDPQKQHDFQYFVDGEIRTSDPFSHKVRTPADDGISEDVYPGLQSYPGDKTENFVSVIRPGQQDNFSFSSFQPPKRKDLVIYELLLRDFVKKSTFSVLTDTLDYLDSLGVNAVELMPVANFGGNSSWGYNPNAHLALDKSYGTPMGFKRFVEEAHRRGIAVIMDVVYNHITDQSPLVQLYGSDLENPFLEPETEQEQSTDRGFCDDFFNELNHGSAFIKRYIDRANQYWIEEFNVDGFRFDLAKCVADDGVTVGQSGYTDAVTSGWKAVSDHVWDNVDSDTYMILEFFGSPNVENELGGYKDNDGNTGSMMTWHNMNRPYSQADMGFLKGNDFSSDFTDSYYGNRGGYDQPSFIAYMESHDEQWLMRRKKAFGNGSGSYTTKDFETALNRQKLVGAFYFTVPGPRQMWQFGELGYGWGENECLKESAACTADDPGRTAPKPIRWDYYDPEQSPNRVKLYKTWSALINLRNRTDVFSSPQTTVSMKASDGDLGRRVVLQHDSMDAVVFGNFDVQERAVRPQFPASGTWYDFFTGAAVTINDDETGTDIPLAPGEFHVFTSKPVSTPESGLVPFASVAPPPEPPTDVSAQIGTDAITISWSASPSSDLTGYALYRGPSVNFDTTGRRLARLEKGTTSYADSDAAEGQTWYYRLVALDADGERSALSGASSAVLYPQSVRFDVSRTFGENSRPQDYRLVALPGEIDRSLEQTLSGTAGENWQAYWDDGSESDFFVQFDGSSTFTLKPGIGFWLISDSTWSVEGTVSTVQVQQGNVTTIDLHEGWNIISNPFDRGVPWSAVREANSGSLQPLWAFSGGFRIATEFASARTGEAFYFLNDGGLDQLTIPYADGAKAGEVTDGSSRTRVNTMSLQAGREGRWVATVEVGWNQEAQVGLDAFDWVAPPSRFASLSLQARSASAPSARKQRLARTVRPPNDRGHSFPVTLHSSSDESVDLRLQNVEAAGDQHVHLVNEATGRSYNLRKTSTPQLEASSETTPLTLLVGTDAYVDEKKTELTSTELQLQPGAPNPFRQKTTLTYTVPEEGEVKLEIFDVLGRRVRVLVDDRKEPGTYHTTWRGGNDAGKTVASGVYLGRLTFKGRTITQKLVLVK